MLENFPPANFPAPAPPPPANPAPPADPPHAPAEILPAEEPLPHGAGEEPAADTSPVPMDEGEDSAVLPTAPGVAAPAEGAQAPMVDAGEAAELLPSPTAAARAHVDELPQPEETTRETATHAAGSAPVDEPKTAALPTASIAETPAVASEPGSSYAPAATVEPGSSVQAGTPSDGSPRQRVKASVPGECGTEPGSVAAPPFADAQLPTHSVPFHTQDVSPGPTSSMLSLDSGVAQPGALRAASALYTGRPESAPGALARTAAGQSEVLPLPSAPIPGLGSPADASVPAKVGVFTGETLHLPPKFH